MNALTTRMPNAFLGFDHLFRSMDSAFNGKNDFPPHDLVRASETEYSVELALAGYDKDDINVVLDNGILNVSGEKSRDDLDYVYRGISGKVFTKRFALSEHIEVKDCEFKNGLLIIHLVKNIPEEDKPVNIKVK